jgi:NitT/TauT family transport system ATP-binding protein
MKKFFEVNNLSKDYSDSAGYNIHLLENISFEIAEGSITSIIAPTGSGKSALLKILSGLDTATIGTIEINSPKGKLVYIPSNPSSFPWYTVEENLHLVTSDESKVKNIIEAVGLEGYENHIPDNNSLGFRFRISLARAIAADAEIVVMDEPFANDIKPVTLERLYSLVLSLRSKFNLTFLLGTSNLSESILLSDKVFVMQKDPGQITDAVEINFNEERTIGLLNTPKFIEYRNQIESILKRNSSQHLTKITV